MDYKDTLNLPKTDFQMKADLSKKEPETLKRWEAEGLYTRIMKAGEGRKKYILHDGPPYANGNIHIGHALNKILKDIVVKSKFMSGFATDYVPGWDCHGLPIELQVEKELGAKKAGVSKPEIRKRCRAYAEKFVNIQREDFKRLGVFGQWDAPYLTMSYGYQASILRELGKFHEKGLIYKGKKPVHWCSSCATALAEAEVEYADKTSPSVYVKFRVKSFNQDPETQERFGKYIEKGTRHYIVIWTTTPWTLPANKAIAVHPTMMYSLKEITIHGQKEIWIIANGYYAIDEGLKNIQMTSLTGGGEGKYLEGTVCEHPFIKEDRKILLSEHVTAEAGTGCVHIAPGHGQDDYELGLKYGLEVYAPVDSHGKFTKEVPEFEGQFVFKANAGIIELLKTKDALITGNDKGKIEHSYPHCWRCKSPIIFRATEQWFASMQAVDLRKQALDAIDNKIQWIPSWGRDRIFNMIQNRPDWCLSRQRAWGVPIPALSCKGCGHSLLDAKLIEKLASAFEKEGADIWFEKDVKDLLLPGMKCPKCGGVEFKKEEDILDVWFDSGVSFAAVLEKRANLKFPADLYLEGSDQHRGWFHSSLLASMGTRGCPPYERALTHGFVVDGSGRKMSKSTGNVVAPQEVIDKYGAEVLRLWVSAEDYREDIRISDEILKRLSEAYRKIRNSFRYILGNLYDFDPSKDMVEYKELEELDRLTLHRLTRLTERVLNAYASFEFHTIYHAVHNFCTVDLSAFYLDALKDRLYTSGANAKKRRAGQTAMYHVLDNLLRLTAPVLVFTSDEAWAFMPGKHEESVHLAAMPEVKKEWLDNGLSEKWDRLMTVKDEISKTLEACRRDKFIGHSLDAEVTISFTGEAGNKALLEIFQFAGKAVDLKKFLEENKSALEDILIISKLNVVEGKATALIIEVKKATGDKCERCWHYSPTVGGHAAHKTICSRCAEALS
ncbi:MAG: isoleucine--tRNA ligase [Deltaproteobacteria bacterium]|nr:isoleucine--tRNA ligase [Deltaproteobacteria bacterium]